MYSQNPLEISVYAEQDGQSLLCVVSYIRITSLLCTLELPCWVRVGIETINKNVFIPVSFQVPTLLYLPSSPDLPSCNLYRSEVEANCTIVGLPISQIRGLLEKTHSLLHGKQVSTFKNRPNS